MFFFLTPEKQFWVFKKVWRGLGVLCFQGTVRGASATWPSAQRPRGAAAGRLGTVPGRLSSGPRGAHVSCPSREFKARSEAERPWRAGSPRLSWGRLLLTFCCRHYPRWPGASGRARKSKVCGKERLSRRDREALPADTPQVGPRDSEHPLTFWSSTNNIGENPGRRRHRGILIRGVRSFLEDSRRAGAATQTVTLPALRRRYSRRGEKWRALAAPPHSTEAWWPGPFSAGIAVDRLECTK